MLKMLSGNSACFLINIHFENWHEISPANNLRCRLEACKYPFIWIIVMASPESRPERRIQSPDF